MRNEFVNFAIFVMPFEALKTILSNMEILFQLEMSSSSFMMPGGHGANRIGKKC